MLIVCIQFKLFCKFLLCHINSLLMHISILVIWVTSYVSWKMIFHVNNLRHIFNLISKSLYGSSRRVYELESSIVRSKISYSICKVLIFRCWALSFNSIQIKLIFIGWATDTPFIIDLWSNCLAMIGCF